MADKPDDFIVRASRELEQERSAMGLRVFEEPPIDTLDMESTLIRAAAVVSQVNQQQPVPVTVTDYALLALADALGRSWRRQQVF
jgi:hypothetical protein